MGVCYGKRCKRRITPINYENITLPTIEDYKLQYPSKTSSAVKRIRSLDGRFLKFMNNSYKKLKQKKEV